MITLEIDQNLKEQVKAQRLRNLQAQYFEFQMNKVAYEANGKIEEALQMDRLMDETDISYNAISAM